jgi:hypothetical protein
MILDDVISHDNKIVISVLSAGIWIYFRTAQCYNMIPRQHLFPVVFVMSWAYINYYEPLALPIGLVTLASFPVMSDYFNKFAHMFS